MKPVAIYIRVSTEDQEKGLRSQEHAINEYLTGHGLKGMWYRDRLSGKDLKRPAFQMMQEAIFNGKHDTIIVWKLDRISRSLRDGINLMGDWLDQGIRVVSVTQQLDFNGTAGRIITPVLFALAELDRENIRENTKRGMRAAKARGVKLGKRPKLFAKDITPLLQQGMSMPKAAKQLGVSRQAIYNALQREGMTPEEARQQ